MIKIPGNGIVSPIERNISSFIRLHIRLSATIELIQSDEEKVIIETDENLQEYIEVINSGRTLYITAEGKWRIPEFTRLKVQIYYRQLYTIHNGCENASLTCINRLQSSEPVDIKINTYKSTCKLSVNAPSVSLSTACVGDVEIEGSCNLFEISTKSEGNLYARNMKANNIILKNHSVGNMEIFANETLIIKNYGVGNIDYRGNGLLKDIQQNGVGEVKHLND